MKLKCPNLLKPLDTIIKQNYWPLYPSEPFSFIHFNMIHPVFGFVVIGVHRKKSTKIQIFLLISESPATFWRLPYKTYFILIAIFCSYNNSVCPSSQTNFHWRIAFPTGIPIGILAESVICFFLQKKLIDCSRILPLEFLRNYSLKTADSHGIVA